MLGMHIRSSGAPVQPQSKSPVVDPLQSFEGTTQ
jgi:hypothetical protein